MSEAGDIESRLRQLKELVGSLSQVAANSIGEGQSIDALKSVKEGLDTLAIGLDLVRSSSESFLRDFDAYRSEYTRYRFGYEEVTGSRPVRAALAFKNSFGHAHSPVSPTDLPIVSTDPPIGFSAALEIPKDVLASKAHDAEEFAHGYQALVREIPESNGSDYYEKASIKAGIITDRYMYNYYKDALCFEYIDPDEYADQIDGGRFQFILYVSCWHGLREDDYEGDAGRQRAAEILDYANCRGVKTIFQSIEDPPHFEKFLCVAKAAQYIFTSDSNMVARYVEETGNENTFVLQYGINPLLHNPIGFLSKDFEGNYKKDVFFAGSWYSDFPIRCVDSERIFDGVLETPGHGLIIADRNYEKDDKSRALNRFPAKYNPYIVPPIDHVDLQKAHRLFDYSICLNSIKDSYTMCAMRVFELQALGALILSNFSLSVDLMFPNIFMVLEKSEVGKILDGYSEEEIIALQLGGIRRMFSNFTVFDRLNQVFETAGVDYVFPKKQVMVLLDYDPAQVSDAFTSYSQSLENTVQLLNDTEGRKSVYESDYFILADSGSPTDFYFLEDAVNAFKFVDVSYVTCLPKGSVSDAYDYCRGVPTINRTLFSTKKVDIERLEDDEYLASLDGFAIIEQRPGRETRHCKKELAVIIPLCEDDAGSFERCFLSLLRSSIFGHMEIYVIGYGKLSEQSEKALRRISAAYDNVYYDASGANNDFSCAFNMGVALCKEDFVTCIRPSTEAINDGYSVLLKKARACDADMAIGGKLVISGAICEPEFVGAYGSVENGGAMNPETYLQASNYNIPDIEASIIKTSFLESAGLHMRSCAVGPSPLFCLSAVLSAGRICNCDIPVFWRNSIRDNLAHAEKGPAFFGASVEAERQLIEGMGREIADEYKKRRRTSVIDAYRAILDKVDIENLAGCWEAFEDICSLYD